MDATGTYLFPIILLIQCLLFCTCVAASAPIARVLLFLSLCHFSALIAWQSLFFLFSLDSAHRDVPD